MTGGYGRLPNGSGPLPRLLNLRQAATYVGLSYWTVRDWVLAGHLPTVALPALRAREGDVQRSSLRRVLIDRLDIDAFIETRKQRAGEPVVQSAAPRNEAGTTAESDAPVPAVCPSPRAR